jgi:hypothetical protein
LYKSLVEGHFKPISFPGETRGLPSLISYPCPLPRGKSEILYMVLLHLLHAFKPSSIECRRRLFLDFIRAIWIVKNER